jgi:phage shock protein C
MSDTTKVPPRRLYRSKKDKVIGGVCGGLGGYLNIDPVVIRVIWLALFFLGGTGFLAYLIAWILIPEADSEEADPGKVERKTDSNKIIGLVLIAVAIIWLGGMMGWFYIGGFPWAWMAPMALVALGAALLLRPKVHEAAGKQSSSDVDSEGLEEPVQTATEVEPAAEIAEQVDEPAADDPTAEEANDESDSDDTDEENKRPFDRWPLRRSKSDRVIGGVCGGLAKYWNTDPTLIRLGCALLSLVSFGIVAIAYLVMLIAISEEEE